MEFNYLKSDIHMHIINISISIVICFFLVLSFKILKKHHIEIKNYYSYDSAKINLIWVAGILIYNALAYLIVIIWFIFNMKTDSNINYHISTIYEFSESIALLIIMTLGIWQSNITPTQTKKPSINKEEQKKILEYVDYLVKFMQKNKPYLNGSLSIDNLAEQLDIKRQYLSEIINSHLKTNFFNFIKEYRVNHVIELMKKEESANIKLLYLAFDSGFNSKSAFNSAFKEVTGKTPSEYLKILEKENS